MAVTSILGVGFSGLAFLFAFLTYKLLSSAYKSGPVTINQLKTIYAFILLTMVLAFLAAASPVIPELVKEETNPIFESAIRSLENRKPMPLDFVKEQIDKLTVEHNKRMETIYQLRLTQDRILNSSSDPDSARELEKVLRETEKLIRQENRDYESKIARFRNML